MEEGQYKLFNILKEIQEWWEAQAIVAVIGQNASVDSEEEDIEEMEHEDGAKIVGEEVSQRFRAERLVFSATEHGDVEVEAGRWTQTTGQADGGHRRSEPTKRAQWR